MMKAVRRVRSCVVISDLHLHEYQDCSHLVKGVNSRLLNGLQVLSDSLEYADKTKSLWIFLGDLHHLRGMISQSTQNRVHDLLVKYSCDKLLLTGNHDWDWEYNRSVLEFFRDIATVITKPRHCRFGEIELYCVPYSDNPVNALKRAKLNEKEIVLMHQGLGDVEYNGIFLPEPIKTKDLPKNHLTLLGHYHIKEQVNKNTYYVGSALPLTWKDIDHGAGRFLFVEQNKTRHKVTSIDTKSPRFVSCRPPKLSSGKYKNNFVRIYYRLGQKTLLDNYRKAVKKAGALHIQTEPLYEGVESSVELVETPHFVSLDKVVEGFCDTAQTTLSKPKLLKIGKSFVGKAQAESEYGKRLGKQQSTSFKFKRLRLEHFMSWEDIDISLENQGLVFIRGENGSGKSALLAGLSWALYRTLDRKIPVSDVVNNQVGKDCLAAATFRGESLYEVVRTRKHQRYGDGLFLKKDKKPLFKNTPPSALQSRLEGIIWDFETFRNTILLTQEIEYFTALTNASQKGILENILGLQVLPACYDIASHESRTVSKGITEKEALSSDANDSLQRLNFQLRKIRVLSQKRVTKLNDLLEVQTELGSQLLSFKKKVSPQVEHIWDEVKDCQVDLRKGEEELNTLTKKLSRVSDYLNQDCPFCGKSIQEEDLDSLAHLHEEDISSLQKETKKQTKLLEKRSRVFEQLKKEKSRVNDILELSRTFGVVTKQLKSSWGSKEKLDQEKKRAVMLKKKISSFNRELESLRQQIQYLDFWVEGFSRDGGLRNWYLGTQLPFLNERIAYYLSFFGPSIELQYEFVKGKLKSRLRHPRGSKTYFALSLGEKQRYNLAVSLALHDLIIVEHDPPNILFLDEIFEHLDARGVENVISILQGLRKDSIFVLSHRKEFADFFNKIWTVKHDGKFSELVT